nr:MFS transporter [Mesorhizobium sp.]
MNRVEGADEGPGSPATFAPLSNPTFRSIWLASQVPLGWLLQPVAISWLMATISTSILWSRWCSRRRTCQRLSCQSLRGLPPIISTEGYVFWPVHYGGRICDADRVCGAGLCRGLDDPGLQLLDRMRSGL